MFFKKNEKEKISRAHFIVASVVLGLSFIAAVAFIASSSVFFVRDNAEQFNESINRDNAATVNEFLIKGEKVLEMACRSIDEILSSDSTNLNRVGDYLTKESERNLAMRELGAGEIYAYINETFIDGMGWVPPAGYQATHRPWYKEALMSQGREAWIPPHDNPRDNEAVITVSRRLSDRKSVVALDLDLNKLQNSIHSVGKGGWWMVLARNGQVIAHSDVTQLGQDYLSSEFWESTKGHVAREVLLSNEKPFSVKDGKKRYRVHSALVHQDWYVVRVVEEAFMMDGVVGLVSRQVFCALLVALLVALALVLSYRALLREIQISRAKSLFLSNMSSEIGTSVNGILGINSILMKEVRDDGLREYVKNIQMASQGLRSLVNDILEVSKIDSGKLETVPSGYDVFTVLSECFDALSPRASAKNLRFSLECDSDLPCSLWGDEKHIRQIISNLLSNAIKYTEVGEVVLSVGFDSVPATAMQKPEDYIMLKISVRDTGVGIREEDLDRVFNAFLDIGRRDVKAQETTGLGLSLTKELVERSGGEITVRSRYGEGSTFMVSIPQLVLNMEPIGNFTARYRSFVHQKKSSVEMLFAPEARVLVVDDVELNLRVFRGMLKSTKIQVDTAINSAQCLKLVQSKQYDLIFLDYVMPGTDGTETLNRIKALENCVNSDTPVVVLVSDAQTESRESYLSLGFVDYLSKPFKEQDLFRILKWNLPSRLILTNADLQVDDEFPFKPVPITKEERDLAAEMILTPAEKLSKFKGILNMAAGLDYCANNETLYLEMLQEYSVSKVPEEMETCFANENWDDYVAGVRNLSVVSSAVGAEDMAKELDDLQNACRRQDYDFVKRNHGKILDRVRDLMSRIRGGLGK